MAEIDYKRAEELEERYDPEMAFRQTSGLARWLVVALLFALSMFHYYTAGFGVLEHHWHVGVHLAFVLGLIYLVYTAHRGGGAAPGQVASTAPGTPLQWTDVVKTGVVALFVYGMMGGTWRTYVSEDAPVAGLVKMTALRGTQSRSEFHYREILEP